MPGKYLTLFLLTFTRAIAFAQAIDNSFSFRKMAGGRDKVCVYYENDLYGGTDRYYTEGMGINWISHSLKKSPVNKVLVHPLQGYTQSGIGIEQNGYTPTDIAHTAIQYGDRPYAACLFVKAFQFTLDTDKKRSFEVTLSTGIIGQATGGKELQTVIHRNSLLNSPIPNGWHNQVNNDVILNYQATYQQQVLSYAKLFSFDIGAMARAGTLSNQAGVFTTIILGHFESPFQLVHMRRFQAFVFDRIGANIVGYDATLQGGMFNKQNPYTIYASDISRFTYQHRFGIVTRIDTLYLEFFRAWLSKEFKTGGSHTWGGFQFTLLF